MFINIKNAVKTYGTGENAINAIDHTSLELNEGKLYVVLGSSGSGKSTLLNMIGGLDTLDSGEITVGTDNITKLSKKELTEYRRKTVGFVFQFYNLIPDLTVRENVEVVKDISENPLDIDDVLESLDILTYADRFPKELSGGQQQRVAIARAIVKNPKILLCDELTGALDTKSSRMVLKCVEKINKKYNTTIIIITHNEAISEMADSVIRIRDGKIESVKDNSTPKSVDEIVL